MLKKLKCKGFTITHHIDIYDRFERRLLSSDFTALRFEEGCALPDESRGYYLVDSVPIGAQTEKSLSACVGLFCDWNTWNGLDIFTPARRNEIVITERVAKALKKLKLTNTTILPVEQWGLSRIPYEIKRLRAYKKRMREKAKYLKSLRYYYHPATGTYELTRPKRSDLQTRSRVSRK